LPLFKITNVNLATFLLITANTAGAFMDTIVDALMVIQARRDPVYGSKELQTLGYICIGISGVVGALIAAFLTGFLNPYWCFFTYSWFGFIVSFSGVVLKKEIETEGLAETEVKTFREESNKAYLIIRETLKIKELNHFLSFMFLVGLSNPNFDEFLYYYKLDIVGFT